MFGILSGINIMSCFWKLNDEGWNNMLDDLGFMFVFDHVFVVYESMC